MGSLAIQAASPAASGLQTAAAAVDMPSSAAPLGGGGGVGGGSSTARPIPEVAEASFLSEVFDVGNEVSEFLMDEHLASRASALGISPTTHRSSPADGTNPPSRESASTQPTNHARTDSSDSDGSTATNLTSHSSSRGATASTRTTTDSDTVAHVVARRRSRNLSFSQYEKYLSHVDPNLKQPKFVKENSPPADSAPSLFSISTRKSYISFKRTLKSKVRWRRSSTTASAPLPISSCICCRDDFSKMQTLNTLPCGHTYCAECLKIMIGQSGTDESKMPPRCCTQPIPASTVRAVLGREEQQAFLKAVLQFSTPWEARVFCPNAACGEFIRPRSRIDPKHPFDVVCRRCRTRVCVMCKRDAHPLGQDCPEDWELEAVLKMGEKSGWRRCYKCRTLVELTQGCTHMTCRCKAQFCYICGAVWDSAVGCPNYCNGEEELERRRQEEEARLAEQEAEKEAREKAAAAAEARTAESTEFSALAGELSEELERFVAFERKTKWVMWSRHTQERLALADRYSDQVEKMKERHAKTVQHLEDRQIAAEMDLRATLEQRARSVRIRLRHMEAYCDGLGRNHNPPPLSQHLPPSPGDRPATASAAISPPGSAGGPPGSSSSANPPPAAANPISTGAMAMPPRVVTERDLRELGQQYNVRDDLERLHQARINVLRDQQTKKLEELQERQESELERLLTRREEEVDDLGARLAAEDDVLARTFSERRARAEARWRLRVEILQKEMEAKTGGLAHGPIPVPVWPDSGYGDGVDDDGGGDHLSTVEE